MTIDEVRAIQIADIRARLAARTQGSWIATLDNDGWCVSSVPDEGAPQQRMETLARLGSGSPASDTSDACFIASAPNDIATLLTEVERLTAERDTAFSRGVAAMREAAAVVAGPNPKWPQPLYDRVHQARADAIRALPDPEDKL